MDSNTGSEEANEPTGTAETVTTSEEVESNWYDGNGFDEETIGYLQTKGWDGIKPMLDSYKGLEKMRGVPEEQLLKLPKDMNPESMGEVWNKLGRPDTADLYSMDVPEGMEVNEDLYGKAKELAFNNGMTGKAFTELTALYNSSLSSGQEDYDTQLDNEMKIQEKELKSEWGTKHDESVFIADKAMRELGVTTDNIEVLRIGLGHDGMYKLFNKIGSLMGEKNVMSADGPISDFGVTPQMAKSEISTIMAALSADPSRYSQYASKGGPDYERVQQLRALR
jgi:hypothetical protein